MTKFQLFSLLVTDNAQIVTINGCTGYVQAIERECGNGRCFNVRMFNPQARMYGSPNDAVKTVFVKTID